MGGILRGDRIEIYYFSNREDRDGEVMERVVGKQVVEEGILREDEGYETEWYIIRWETVVSR